MKYFQKNTNKSQQISIDTKEDAVLWLSGPLGLAPLYTHIYTYEYIYIYIYIQLAAYNMYVSSFFFVSMEMDSR